MPKVYKVVYKSCSQWQGTEVDNGDTGQEFKTKEEAEAHKAEIEASPNNDIISSAIEAQGVEGWLEVQEVEYE